MHDRAAVVYDVQFLRAMGYGKLEKRLGGSESRLVRIEQGLGTARDG